MTFLGQRQLEPERMDDPELRPEPHRRALEGLARLNGLANVAGAIWKPLCALAAERPGAVLSVIDAATGGGDLGPRIARRARRAGVDLRWLGLDRSATALELARERARRAGLAEAISYRRCDLLGDALPEGADAIVASLFLHHLDEAQAVDFLARCRAAGPRRIVIHDLDRSAFGWMLAASVPRLVTGSGIVHTDARLSVRAAWRPDQALGLARRAGLSGARVAACWPARWQLEWSA